MTAIDTISPQSAMREVLEAFPGAQRALFRRYHIGGCSSCAFQPTETLEQLCARNGNLNVAEVLDHIKASHEQDAKIFIEPAELAALLKNDPSVRLVDVRSREEAPPVWAWPDLHYQRRAQGRDGRDLGVDKLISSPIPSCRARGAPRNRYIQR